MAKERIIINPAVPPELKKLAEAATRAVIAHTAEGKSIVVMELRKRFDEAVDGFRNAGVDKLVPDDKIKNRMIAAYVESFNLRDEVGEEHREEANSVFADTYHKAAYEGFMMAYALFGQFKDDVLIENEKDEPPPKDEKES